MKNPLVQFRGQNAKRTTERQRESLEKLKEYTESVQVLENGARFYKLKPGPAMGAEFAETWRNRL